MYKNKNSVARGLFPFGEKEEHCCTASLMMLICLLTIIGIVNIPQITTVVIFASLVVVLTRQLTTVDVYCIPLLHIARPWD